MAAATSSSLWLVEKTRSGLLGKRGTGHRRFRLSDKHCSWPKRSEYTASRQRFPRCLVFSRSPKACASALSPRIIAAVPVVQHLEPRVRCWRVHTHWAVRPVVGLFRFDGQSHRAECLQYQRNELLGAAFRRGGAFAPFPLCKGELRWLQITLKTWFLTYRSRRKINARRNSLTGLLSKCSNPAIPRPSSSDRSCKAQNPN
jgi:hypothetical protein